MTTEVTPDEVMAGEFDVDDREDEHEALTNTAPIPTAPTRKPMSPRRATAVSGQPGLPVGVTEAALADLNRPTPQSEIKQRPALKKGGGQAYKPDGTPLFLSYVDARYVQDTLDEMVGPANWQSQFQDTMDGVRAGIGINVRGVGWVWKWDAGVPSNIEPVKGAHSDALKRAAVNWGIARDLYDKADDDVDAANAPAQLPTVQQAAQGAARQTRYAGSAPQAAAGGVVQTDTRTAEEVEQAAYDQGLAWACELHPSAGVRYTAAGVSREGRPYAARIRCGERNCRENGPIIP